MPSNLHQLELAYNPLEDRLLLKFYTQDLAEFSFWLTRRFTKIFCEILMKLLEEEKKSTEEKEKDKQKVAKNFEDEKSKKNPSADKYGTKISTKPMGKDPILASRLAFKPLPTGQYVLGIQSETGMSIEIVADNFILHALCKLLSETIKKADWDLNADIG